MGTDINGWVEFRQAADGQWNHCIDISLLIDRNYDAFGCLFGVKNYARFAPLAAKRGLPADRSAQVAHDAAEMEGFAFGHTWIGWATLQAIDLDETALAADERVHQYRRDDQGNLLYEGKATWSRELAVAGRRDLTAGRVSGAPLPRRPDKDASVEGQEWAIGDRIYRAERLRRRDALGDDWQTLFAMMAPLADHYGAANVRLIAWFVE